MRRVPRLLLVLSCAALCAVPSAAQESGAGGDSGSPAPATMSEPSHDADSGGRDAAPAQGDDKAAAAPMGGSDDEKKPADEGSDDAQSSMKITVQPAEPAAGSAEAPTPAPAPKPARKPKAKPKKKPKKKAAVVSTPEPGARKSAPVVAAPAAIPAVPLTPVQPENP